MRHAATVREASADDVGRLRDDVTEQLVLEQILTWPQTWPLFRDADLSTDDFAREHRRLIYRAIAAVDADGLQPDVGAVLARVRTFDTRGEISAADVIPKHDVATLRPAPANVAATVEHLKTLARARAVHYAALKLRAALIENPAAVDNGLLAEHRARLDQIVGSGTGTESSDTLPALIARLATAPARAMVFEDLLALGEIALLHGQPRDGKTWLSLELAIALALKMPPFGLARFCPARPGRSLTVSNEDSESAYVERLGKMCAAYGVEPPDGIRLFVGRGIWLDDSQAQRWVIDEIRREQIDLLVLDPCRSLTGCVDQGPNEIQPFARFLRRVITETGVAILLVHHDTKPLAGVTDSRRRAHRASGGGLFSIVDAPIHVERLDQTRSLCTPDGFKHRPDPAPFVIERQATSAGIRLVGETTSGISAEDVALQAAVTEYLRTSGGGSGRAIATAVRRRRDDVNRTLERMLQAGIVDSAEGPKRAKLWCLR